MRPLWQQAACLDQHIISILLERIKKKEIKSNQTSTYLNLPKVKLGRVVLSVLECFLNESSFETTTTIRN